MSIHEGITFPEELGLETRIERIMFRMTLPLTSILANVEGALHEIEKVDCETKNILQTTRIDPALLAPATDCSVCGLTLNPARIPTVDLAPAHRLPCNHKICGTCLTNWLAKAGSCPFCRHRLTSRIFIDDEFDPRSEAYARPILEEIILQGRTYLQTDPADITFRGFYNSGANGETTEEFSQKMEILELLFQQYSTALEDFSLRSELGQNFKIKFWEENAAKIAAGWTEQAWRAMRSGIESPDRQGWQQLR